MSADDPPLHANQIPEAVTMDDACRLLGCARATVIKLIAQGHLAPFRLSERGWRRFPIDQINALRKNPEGPNT